MAKYKTDTKAPTYEASIALHTQGQMLVELADMLHECGGEPFCIDDSLIKSWAERLFDGIEATTLLALGRLQRQKLVAQDGSMASGEPLYMVTPTGRDCADDCRHQLAMERIVADAEDELSEENVRLDQRINDQLGEQDEAERIERTAQRQRMEQQLIDAEQDEQSRRTLDSTTVRYFDEVRRQAREAHEIIGPLMPLQQLKGLTLSRRKNEVIVVGSGENAAYIRVDAVKGERVVITVYAPGMPIDRYEVRQRQLATGATRTRAEPDVRSKPETQDRHQAFCRVSDARCGSLAGKPTIEYLNALQAQVHDWLREISAEISSISRA